MKNPNFKVVARTLSLVLALMLSTSIIAQEDKEHQGHHHDHSAHDMEAINKLIFLSDDPDAHKYGAWESVIPELGGGAIGKSLGMQTVHSILLPSGKILMTSGSSWRNLAPMEYYPEFQDPVAGKGLFDRRYDPFHKTKIQDYYQLVNNTAIYDPEKNTFFRIHSPYPETDPTSEDHFVPNDFFCTGHLQLRDGNPFFSGGTQYYFPYRTGNATSYIFDWRKELSIDWQYVDWRQKPQQKNDPWMFSGLMERGRWYPTIVPLVDGRFVVSGGYVGFDKGFPEMYQFEINHFVEFFNYDEFDVNNPQKAWRSVDVKKIKDSPFATLLDYPQKIDNICYDMRHLEKLGFDIMAKNFVQPCDCPPRCADDHLYDAFKLYAHNYLLERNKIYLSREGEWVSLRTPKTEYMRRTKFTYWMEIKGTKDSPKIEFTRGPDRPDTTTNYGTSYLDPNSKTLTILGGQPASSGTLLPLGSEHPNRFAGGRGTRKIEKFHLNKEGGEGYWTLEKDFLGEHPQDDRTMHYAIILPTRQILIINGGNYDFYGEVKYPLLLTPIFDKDRKFVKYKKERMAEAVEPRLYHNGAMLLPDGRIFVSGGNSGRATVRLEEEKMQSYHNGNGQPLPNNDLVELDLYFLRDGQMARQEKGADNTPIENWTAEIFSPPYLFSEKEGEVGLGVIKRMNIYKIETKPEKGVEFQSKIGGKDFYLFHSNKKYKLELGGILPRQTAKKKHSLVLLKIPSATHGGQWGQLFIDLPLEKKKGNNFSFTTPDAEKENIPPGFYMLFFVDSNGKPSKAKMVRFDDRAVTP